MEGTRGQLVWLWGKPSSVVILGLPQLGIGAWAVTFLLFCSPEEESLRDRGHTPGSPLLASELSSRNWFPGDSTLRDGNQQGLQILSLKQDRLRFHNLCHSVSWPCASSSAGDSHDVLPMSGLQGVNQRTRRACISKVEKVVTSTGAIAELGGPSMTSKLPWAPRGEGQLGAAQPLLEQPQRGHKHHPTRRLTAKLGW